MTDCYIKDLQAGTVRLYGINNHDSLEISPDGLTLSYSHLQNGDGSLYGDYRFCDENGRIPSECEQYLKYGAEAYFNIGGWNETAVPDTEQLGIIRCRDCKYWTDEYIRLNDGRCRAHAPEADKDEPLLHKFVSIDTGINIGSKCQYEFNRGWDTDHTVYRNADDFCSRAEKRPCSYEQWHGMKDGFYPDDWNYGGIT